EGPSSGQTTLDANTLVLHLTWLHEPLLPGVKQLLKQLAPRDSRYGSLAMARAGYLPIHREVAMVMQSHAVEWPMPEHGRMARNRHYSDVEPNFQGGAPKEATASPEPGVPGQRHSNVWRGEQPCVGLWCLPTYEGRPPILNHGPGLPYHGSAPSHHLPKSDVHLDGGGDAGAAR